MTPLCPSRPFGSWLTQVIGPKSGVSWRLGECVEQNGVVSEWEQGVRACVEATAVAQIHVGSFKQWLSAPAKLHFAGVESDSQFHSVRRLSDLPQLLPRPVLRKGAGRREKAERSHADRIRSNGAPQLYYAKSATLFGPPRITAVETGGGGR